MKESYCEIDVDKETNLAPKQSRPRVRARLLELKTRLDLLRSLPYSDYLLTGHWEERRKSALKRASYACQSCGDTNQLEVHHNTYKRLGCELPWDLEVLCRDCHQRRHNAEVEL